MSDLERQWRRWCGYWFAPGPLLDLAVTRIVLVGLQLALLPKLARQVGLRTDAPDSLYHPLRLLQLFTLPFEWAGHGVHLDASAWHVRPSEELVDIVLLSTVLVGVLALVGLATRFAVVGFAIGTSFLMAYVYSFHEIHHPEAIMVLGLLLVGFGPCGRTLSLDALRHRVRRSADASASGTDTFARWPLLTVGWLLALVYLSAAWAKVETSGLEWLNGYTLRSYLLRDGLRGGIELGVTMAQYHLVAVALSWITLVFQATFVLVMLFRRLAWVYLPIGVALHLGVQATIGAPFPQVIAAYAVFVPWSLLAERVRSSWSRPSLPSAPATL
jgi:uncharacterized membrane protein YphA (DoxX/SURF4 family)